MSEKWVKKSVFLIGFMGVGKSSITLELGHLLGLDTVEMDEYIVAACYGNEAKAFFVIEPFYCTCFHDRKPPFFYFSILTYLQKMIKTS